MNLTIMTQYEKLLEKFKNNPGSITFNELKKILLKHGYEEIQGKGSHVVFKNILGNNFTIALHDNDCKTIYKKEVKKVLFSD